MRFLPVLFSLTLFGSITNAQTSAPAVTAVDCTGNPHDLHAILDAGKIIVIGWAMPCSSCAPPLLEINNTVINYAVSNPGVVEYWLFDDFANTSCPSFKNWCVSNGITSGKYFSDPAMNMNDFGGYGMPKAVVVGCTSHTIYYNVNFTPTGAGVAAAIDQALIDMGSGCTAAVDELPGNSVIVYPNPVRDELRIKAEDAEELESINLFTLTGQLNRNVDYMQSNGELILDLEPFSEGIYIIQLNFADRFVVRRIQITN